MHKIIQQAGIFKNAEARARDLRVDKRFKSCASRRLSYNLNNVIFEDLNGASKDRLQQVGQEAKDRKDVLHIVG